MSRRMQVMYMFFARLPEFTIMNLVLNFVLLVAYDTLEYRWLTWLFVIPFALFFMLREDVSDIRTGIAAQLVSGAVLAAAIYVFSPDDTFRIIMLIFVSFLLIHSLFPRADTVSDAHAIAGTVINAFAAAFLTMFLGSEPLFFLLLLNTCVSLMCIYLVRYFEELDFLVRSRVWRQQPKAAAKLMLGKSLRLALTFIAALSLALLIILMQNLPLAIELIMEIPKNEEAAHLESLIILPEERFYREPKKTPLPENESTVLISEEGEVNEPLKPLSDEAKRAILISIILAIIILCIIFYKRTSESVIRNEDFDEDTESGSLLNRGSRRRMVLRRENSLRRKVRAAYIKKVNSHRKLGLEVKTNDTAKRLSDEINLTENITSLDALYHVARYSNDSISKADITRIKNQHPDT